MRPNPRLADRLEGVEGRLATSEAQEQQLRAATAQGQAAERWAAHLAQKVEQLEEELLALPAKVRKTPSWPSVPRYSLHRAY
jgi:hypothetical protein